MNYQVATERQQAIVNVFLDHYSHLIALDADAWRGKFRKMASSPFAFYRGSAALFYRDIHKEEDPFINEKTGKVWIQGDLHAQNFGTYMNADGILVFDVNDFDEAYPAPFTWDIKRLAASMALIGYEKALSDAEIREIIETMTLSYVRQVSEFIHRPESREFSLNLRTTKGKLLHILQKARLLTRVNLLEFDTEIADGDRRLRHDKNSIPVDEATLKKAQAAFQQYLTTIPTRKKQNQKNYHIKDVVTKRGMGIGSAGLPQFTFLLEGDTEALENDILVIMKQSQEAAPTRYVPYPVENYFLHNGHRTVLSQRALQAHTDPWLGWSSYEGEGRFCTELSPYFADMDWSDINRFDEIIEVVTYFGQAVAKIHCVSDEDSDQEVIPFSVEEAIHDVLNSRETEFVNYIADFGERYGQQVREDHQLFVDAFRNKQFPI